MSSCSIQQILAEAGAVLTGGHFVYTSKKHGSAYVAKDVLYTDPVKTSAVCAILALDVAVVLKESSIEEVVVVCPVAGGVAISQWLTFHLLREGIKAAALFADKAESVKTSFELPDDSYIRIGGTFQKIPEGAKLFFETETDEGFVLKRGYDKRVSGKKVVIGEDVLNTGGSVASTIEAVRKAGGEVVLVVAICNRGGVTSEQLGVPCLISGVQATLQTFPPDECPLCARGIPVDLDHGHGKAFLASKAKTSPV